jgi:hypothetical protein
MTNRIRACLAILGALAVSGGPPSSAQSNPSDIAEPRPGASLGMTSPATLAGFPRAGSSLPSAYRWSLKNLQTGRLIEIPQAPGSGGDGFSLSNRVVNVIPGQLNGVAPGRYELTLETLFAPLQPDSPPTVATRTISINIDAEILTTTGVAPGRVVPGEARLRLYGRALNGAQVELTGPVFDPDAPGAGGCPGPTDRCPRMSLAAAPGETGTHLTFSVPPSAKPGLYRVTATRGRLRSRSRWLRVEASFAEPTPRPDRRGMARLLVSGQTVRERFLPRGASSGGLRDYEVYYFVAAAGATIDVTLQRVDKSKTWEHPEELDPEIYVVAPSGVVLGHLVGTDVRPGIDLNAAIRRGVLPYSGLYFLVAGTTKGSGEYDLSFFLAPAPPGSAGDRALLVSDPMAMTNSRRAAQPIWALLDPRGYPISGAAVNFVAAEGTKDEALEFPEGAATRTTIDGFAPGRVLLVTPGMIGIASELYRCVLTDPLFRKNPDPPLPPFQIPRVPLAGSALAQIRDVDVVRGDMLLSKFDFQKEQDKYLGPVKK